jgi:hypothetical protein
MDNNRTLEPTLTISQGVAVWETPSPPNPNTNFVLEVLSQDGFVSRLAVVSRKGSISIAEMSTWEDKPRAIRLREKRLFGKVLAITAFPTEST